MIIAEEKFIPLFETLPEIVVSGSGYKALYDFGSEEDLLRLLNQKSKEGGKIYPLIWLETPVALEGKNRKYGKFKFILATLSNSELSNRERLELTVKPTLIPLRSNMIKAFKQSGFTRILNQDQQKDTIYYNFGTKEIGKRKKTVNKATDIWDAIKFECELEFTDCKQRNINY